MNGQAQVSEDLHVGPRWILEADMLELNGTLYIIQDHALIPARIDAGLPVDDRKDGSH